MNHKEVLEKYLHIDTFVQEGNIFVLESPIQPMV